jgi:hypothetical protein
LPLRLHLIFRASLCYGLLSLAVVAPVAAAPLDLAAHHGRVVYLDFWASR